MSAPTIDSSQWPYVEIVYQPSMTGDDLDSYRDALDSIYARGAKQPFVCVVDTRRAPTERATLNVRRHLVSIVDAVAKQYPNAMLAEAVVLEGEIAASVYMAYTWLLRDKRIARRSFRNRDEAVAWAQSFLAKSQQKASRHP